MIPQNSQLTVTRLLLIILGLVVDDIEELELVDTLGGGYDAEPVTELHLLEELLGPTTNVSIMLLRSVVGTARTYRYLR